MSTVPKNPALALQCLYRRQRMLHSHAWCQTDSRKTTHSLPAYASNPRAAYADAPKNVDMIDLEEAGSCACPEILSEEEHHEDEERSASRSDIGAYGGDFRIERIGMGEPAGEP